MRIVGLDDFLDMPSGTIFSKAEKDFQFQTFGVKGVSWDKYSEVRWLLNCNEDTRTDWKCQCERMLNQGAHSTLRNEFKVISYSDQAGKFLIFERDDLLWISELVTTALIGTVPADYETPFLPF